MIVAAGLSVAALRRRLSPEGRIAGKADAAGEAAVISGTAIWLTCLLVLLPAATAWSADVDARWELSISGHNSYLFGEPGLGGGLRIPWEVVIQFQVEAGEYRIGSGRARWLDRVVPLSQPPGWFSCRQVAGTYLDSNLALHETPRVRFAGFPVAGEVRDARVVLQPGYRPPGNYLAVTYECTTENPRAYNWFPLGERGKQILGKRQDTERTQDGDRQHVRVREVASLPPEGSIELPLEDDWSFVQGGEDDASLVRYRLRRLD
jgi:hypothetical protein